jgi:anti-sigma regulatory factor (Ser/Thr protein kinase)
LDVVTDAQAPLFSAPELGETQNEPSIEASNHAAFVNPHLAGPEIGESDLRTAVRPWLRRLLRARKALDTEREQFAEAAGVVVDELLSNVREHAARGLDGQPTESLVTVSFIGDRLHIAVTDTGPGLLTTATPKLPPQLTRDEVVEALLMGTYRGWDRGRGLGLPQIWDIALRYSGSIFIATGATRVQSKHAKIDQKHDRFDLAGTVMSATLNAP